MFFWGVILCCVILHTQGYGLGRAGALGVSTAVRLPIRLRRHPQDVRRWSLCYNSGVAAALGARMYMLSHLILASPVSDVSRMFDAGSFVHIRKEKLRGVHCSMGALVTCQVEPLVAEVANGDPSPHCS